MILRELQQKLFSGFTLFWSLLLILVACGDLLAQKPIDVVDREAIVRSFKSLAYKVAPVAKSPLPFQAARVRISLYNEGDAAIRGLYPLESGIGSMQVSGPASRGVRKLNNVVRWMTVELPFLGGRESKTPRSFELDSKHETSVSFPVACDWAPDSINGLNPLPLPILTTPGQYALSFTRHVYVDAWSLEAKLECNVSVREPEGKDREIVALFQGNPKLATAMLETTGEPPPEIISQIKTFIDRFPESSYTDYARFALARSLLHGSGFRNYFSSGAVQIKYYRDLLVSFDQKDGESVTEEGLWEALNNVSNLGKLSGERAVRARKALASRHESTEAFRDAVDILAELDRSNPEKKEAIGVLRGIESKEFTYRSNVLISLYMALCPLDENLAQNVARELDSQFPDDLQWIFIKSSRIENRGRWTDFRVHRVASDANK